MDPSKKLTKKERIALRAARVQAKRNKDDPRASSAKDKSSEDDIEKALLSKLQITKSRNTVDQAKTLGETAVSDVAVDREHAESIRRRKEMALREERYERLERELKESQRINQEIEEKWEEVAEKNIPQELYAAISAQYKKASSLLSAKDELIKSLQLDLKRGDEAYVELLSNHQEDINLILKRLSDNFASFLKTVKKELVDIEEAFLKERAELLEKNKEEIEALFEKRRKMELVMMESKQIRERKFAQELVEIRNRDAEDYNALKIDLESSIAIFEQQLEEMRATYQLNSEKLEYNHAVLVERDQENKATVEHHRQRLRRLKETLAALIAKSNAQDAKWKSENAELTADYKRMTEAFKDLQKKYAHFVTIDTRKYADVWSMNEEHVMQLVHKLLKADQIVHGQILGVEWKPPLLPADIEAVTEKMKGGAGGQVRIEEITSAQIFLAGQHTDAVAAQMQQQQAAAVAQAGETGKGFSPTAAASSSSSDPASSSSASATAASPTAAPPSGSKFTPAQIKSVLDLLCTEVGFLLDSRIQETVLALEGQAAQGGAADPKAEADLYRADGLLSAIGVEDREDLESLVSAFFDSGAPGPNGELVVGPHEKPSVHPNDVAKVLREFVLKRQQQVKTKSATSAAFNLKAQESVVSEKKARRKERERLFWHRLGHVVSDHTLGVWGALEKWLHQYNSLLEERANLIEETSQLAAQNEELKQLLAQYLGSKVNEELQIPPTRLIRVNK